MSFLGRHWWWIALAVVVLLAGAGFAWWRLAQVDVIPATVRQSATFELYQPRGLPTGFAVDKGSFAATSQVVTFAITYQPDKKLLVSQQPKPAEFDFEDFYDKQLAAQKRFTTPAGAGVVGVYQGAGLGSILIDQTWILVRAPAGISATQLEQVMQSLAK